MSAQDEGVTLPEVNRNVIELRRQVEGFGMNYVPLKLWEENRLEVGRRVGAIENELAEKRRGLTNSFLFPLLLIFIGAAVSGFVTFVIATSGG